MHPIGTALASFGLSSRVFHAPFLKDNRRYSVAGVLERRAARARDTFPDAAICRTYAELLTDSTVELVVVNTPDHLHFEMCEQAILAGKHVLVEKPMAENAIRARKLFTLAERHGVVLTVYHNRRFDGDFMALQRLIGSGALGRVLEFESRFEVYRPVDPAAWREQAGSGGILTNLGPHLVDQAIALFGAPQWVYAKTMHLRRGSRIPDYLRLELGFPDRAVVLGASYQAFERMPRFVVRGTDGSWTKWGYDSQEVVLKAATAKAGGPEVSLIVGTPAAQPIPTQGLAPKVPPAAVERRSGTVGKRTRGFPSPRLVTPPGGPVNDAPGGASAGGREYSVMVRHSPVTHSNERTGAFERIEHDTEVGDYGLFYNALYDAIRDGAPPPVTREQALLTAAILYAAAQSAAIGLRVTLEDRIKAGDTRPDDMRAES